MGQITTVNFRGATLVAFEEPDGKFVAVKPIVDGMGISWHGQMERLKRDPILSKGTRVMRVPFGPGGAQEALCLRLNLIQGWLFTIDSSRIKDEELRARVIAYQEECYDALHRHFVGEPETQAFRGELLPPAEIKDVTDWPLEELRAKQGFVEMYRRVWGIRAAQWIAAKLGCPVPEPGMIEHGRQLTLVFEAGEDVA